MTAPRRGRLEQILETNGPLPGEVLIANERQRQRSLYDPEHDAEHPTYELVRAAMAYLLVDGGASTAPYIAELQWPWDKDSFKPSSQDANLIKAGALVAAALDHLLGDPEPSAYDRHAAVQELANLLGWQKGAELAYAAGYRRVAQPEKQNEQATNAEMWQAYRRIVDQVRQSAGDGEGFSRALADLQIVRDMLSAHVPGDHTVTHIGEWHITEDTNAMTQYPNTDAPLDVSNVAERARGWAQFIAQVQTRSSIALNAEDLEDMREVCELCAQLLSGDDSQAKE